jgi:hypothetical protein
MDRLLRFSDVSATSVSSRRGDRKRARTGGEMGHAATDAYN